ncbi:hypothetical protein ACSP50_4759 [Actinoplanes sp. SE50/110]|nr:hypothetical protein ACSP50_4759 [Actinoplanes sp. SE50/110]
MVTTAFAAFAVPAAALAAPMPSAGTADFAVSTPAQRLAPDAQGRIRTELSIANRADHDLDVKIRTVGVVPGDDGQARFTDRPDPAWSAKATFPPTLTLGPGAYRRVPVTLTVPGGLLPDIYLLGFVVEAQPGAGATGIRVYHQIGALVTVELPGPRQREMAVEVAHTGFIHLGATMESTYRVRNVGAAAALGRGQVKVDSTLSDTNIGVYRGSDDLQLFPSGTSRTLTYRYVAHGLFLIARPQGQVLYGSGGGLLQTAQGTGQAILIVPWPTIIALCLLVVLLTGYLYWRRRRRIAARGVHRRGRSGKPACAG